MLPKQIKNIEKKMNECTNKRIKLNDNLFQAPEITNDNNQDMLEDVEISDQQQTNIPPLLVIDVPELKDPKKLKNAIKTNLNGINIKQIKFTNNNNMLIYLYDTACFQCNNL